MGRDGAVNAIDVVCSAQQMGHLIDVVNQVAPETFLYTHNQAGRWGGYVYSVKGET
jgi:hypothetical protein